ncbi:MAG: GNAT family N-acetyltransferase [Proteobacteria bacterium]|nr:GNAT family N-acetyltransferase [Pseudomonadota bacterium]
MAVATDVSTLTLDGLRQDDAAALFQYRSDPTNARYQSWQPKTESEAAEFIRSLPPVLNFNQAGWYQLALRYTRTKTLVGDIGIHVVADDPTMVELGITLAKDWQHKGLATVACTDVIKQVFAAGKTCVNVSCDPRNTASIRLWQRLGFRHKSFRPAAFEINGELVDDLVLELLPEDWQKHLQR